MVRPAEGSVSQKIQELFSSLNTVAQDPSDLASRHVAADASKALVNSITTVANGISDLRTFVSQDIESNIVELEKDKLFLLQNIVELDGRLIAFPPNQTGFSPLNS